MSKELTVGESYNKEEIESSFETNFGAYINGINLRRTSADRSYIIVFSRTDGPYADREDEGSTIYYMGEGQNKDQELTARNKALVDAIQDGRTVYGFRQNVSDGKWIYLGELRVASYTYLPKNGFKTYEFKLLTQATGLKAGSVDEFPNLPKINEYILSKQFLVWKSFVESKDGQIFTSFGRSAYLKEAEEYKKDLNNDANQIMAVDGWQSDQVGTGEILKKVIQSIEQKDNNLVFTSSHAYTRQGAPHAVMLSAIEDAQTSDLELVLYNLFKDQSDDKTSFDSLVELIGRRYSVVAYLFFLKNIKKYMPIAPSNFDAIFSDLLNIDFKTSHQCSWDNYLVYNGLIKQVAKFLSNELNEQVSLIDAHSFLWMIGNHITGSEDNDLISVEAKEVQIDNSYEFNSPSSAGEPLASTPFSINESNVKNAKIGEKGEYIVLLYERKRLRAAGKDDLAEKVLIVSSDNSSLGYDIASYTLDGEEMQIEVKATTSKSTGKISFIITPNEFRVCRSKPNYYLYHVSDINGKPFIQFLRKPFERASQVFDPIIFAGGMAQSTRMRITLKLKH